jgi:hypothetical protein
MKQTKNRLVIIKCLTEHNEDCGGAPPFCADSIRHMLEYNYEWYGAAKPVSISQINRTLRDLNKAGLIVFESRICDPIGDGLPQRVKFWQMAADVDRNKLLCEIDNACNAAKKAHGTFLFSRDVYFDKPMDSDQKNALIKELKALMQRTHPDKVTGLSDEFKRLKQSLNYVRSNTDLIKNPAKELT